MIDLEAVKKLYAEDWDMHEMCNHVPALVSELESARKVVEAVRESCTCGGQSQFDISDSVNDALTAYDNLTQKEA